jgi:hypothetical protein
MDGEEKVFFTYCKSLPCVATYCTTCGNTLKEEQKENSSRRFDSHTREIEGGVATRLATSALSSTTHSTLIFYCTLINPVSTKRTSFSFSLPSHIL